MDAPGLCDSVNLFLGGLWVLLCEETSGIGGVSSGALPEVLRSGAPGAHWSLGRILVARRSTSIEWAVMVKRWSDTRKVEFVDDICML